ncbi:YabP/YqfC family sporulation protein [Thermocaproicibacter melissae]|uniref:YabP/YqfC family sporulation protein n=2 Tax=Thermocaproicibacter melissae TaxID=2966552 RepID=UPI0024B1996B|nr:YabP/YqfC family sporulation protein [Thermocaproicibacter melissae]WBY64548.1 YabP/YqfC family sporulation protein [Thermocaproicibacter melissae]
MLEMSGLSIQSHMELNGNREAVVEGCGGVLEYDETVVRVRTPNHVVRFTGRGLTIRCLTADALVVTGYITGIEFLD